ncbi:MAG: phosphate acyltransferase PlsX [Oscillospiraceae bacterium]|jgi:glycerol-3-phosphate acyltransferase PlsX|nr:phosphate acyltransferase PlsX [Oscillospiraceae bacterium]
MKIILDAMGGDNAPGAVVRGALLAQQETDAGLLLVGRGEDILQVIKDEGLPSLPPGLEIAHASQVVGMEDNPSSAIKDKPDSSIVVGLNMLAEGRGDAFVSAGSTGAVLTGATLLVKRIRGIRRAALSPILPTERGGALLIDSGATADCTPEYLLQFACMGSLYMKHAQGIEAPRVGLLNIGAEETKGDELRKAAHKLLKQAHEKGLIRFVGNVEARDVAFGAADVVVADGFSGNILLKASEGIGLYFVELLKRMYAKNLKSKLGALLVKDGLRSFKKVLDYAEYGGAPFLGVSRPVIKAHGSSNPRAIASSIRQAQAFARADVTRLIAENIEGMKLPEAEGGFPA